jgi:hypothetical protein
MKFISLLCLILLVGCDQEPEKPAAPKEPEGIKIYNSSMGDEYVLPLSKVSKVERARVETILERQKRDPMGYNNTAGCEYESKAEEYSDARALMTDWLVAEKCPKNLQKLRNLRAALQQWHYDGGSLACSLHYGANAQIRQFYEERMYTEEFLAKLVFSDSGKDGDKAFNLRKLIATIPDFKKHDKEDKKENGVGYDLKENCAYSIYVTINKDYWSAVRDLVDVEEALRDWSPDAARKVAALIKEHIKILE